MTIITEGRKKYRQGSVVTKLIYINTALFLTLYLLNALFILIGISDNTLWIEKLYLPWNINTLLGQPWSVITYMFTNSNWWHLLFNMLFLYWFGEVFLINFTSNQLRSLYIIGGFVSAVIYIAIFNLIPYFTKHDFPTTISGAPASIMAIAVAASFRSPNYILKLPVIRGVKIKYLIIALIIFNFTMISSDNVGVDFALLGGILTGWLFIKAIKYGKDITSWMTAIFVWLSKLLTKNYGISLHKPAIKAYYGDKTKDFEYNANKKKRNLEIDKILDKIRESGYECLSEQEKKKLFEAGDK